MSQVTLAQILRRHWPAYVERYGAGNILPSHHAAVSALLSCHTPACGGSLYACPCGQRHFTWHGCGHRACPQCGQREAAAWAARQRARLLPVPYHLATFTVPEELRTIVRSNQRILLDMIFKESAATLREVGLSKLRCELGFIGALHTWSRQLIYHPHVHYVIPALGITPNGSPRVPPNPHFLLRVEVLSARFRSRMRRALREHPSILARIPAAVWRKDWVVHSQPAGSGQEALTYLSRYIYRTAIGADRQLQEQNGFIAFTYRDSQTRQPRTARLPALMFIARFLQHVLPKRLRRVRAYGWLSPAAKAKLQRLRSLIGAPLIETRPASPEPVVVCCPECNNPMLRIARFGRAPPC